MNNRGKRTTYTYDLPGRLIRRRPWADSAAVRDSMVYDIAGNLRKTYTRRGHVITHAYDSRNRDTLTVIPGVGDLRRAFGGPQDQVTRLWLANAVDSIGGVNGEVRSGFDARGRLKADTVYTGATPRVTTYAYDNFERPVTTTDALGTWTLQYHAVRGYADTLVTPMGDVVSYTYTALGELQRRDVTSSSTLRMRSQQDFKWNRSLGSTATTIYTASEDFVAGAFGRATKDTSALALTPRWIEQHGVGAALDTLRDSTAYDSWGRLIRWAPMKGTSLDGPGEEYTYDTGGNLRVVGETMVIDPVTERLTSRTVGGVTTSYTYDRAGNLITRSSGGVTWSYGYDPLDRLVSVRRNSVLIARYGYDVLGRRIVKRVYSSASGGTVGYTRFVYKGSHVSFETDSAGTIGLRYTWGAGTDDLVAITTATGAHYYVTTDKLGSVRSIAKRDGTWQLSQRFDPYGRMIARDSATGSTIGSQLRYGWTGREWDAETGFSYHRARYFDPESRRWTQEDPIGYAGGVNVYAYVEGSPLEATDPSGLNKSIDYWASVPTIRPSGASARLDALYAWGDATWMAFLSASAPEQYQAALAAQGQSAADQVWARQQVANLVKSAEGKCVIMSCPGNMTRNEYSASIAAIQEVTWTGTQIGLLTLLIDGRIQATTNRLTMNGAEAIAATSWRTADISVTRNYGGRGVSGFDYTAGELSFVLAHEYSHHATFERAGASWREANVHLVSDAAFVQGLESGANMFACSVTASAGRGRFSSYCGG